MLEQSRADWEKRFASTAASVARSKEIEDQRRAQVPHRTTANSGAPAMPRQVFAAVPCASSIGRRRRIPS
jgi:hypothetical protein